MTPLTAPTIAPPFGRYAHGVEIPAGWRIVMTSGQLPLAVDGTVPEGAEAQAALCFANCGAIIAEAGMGPADVVRVAAFVTDRAHMPENSFDALCYEELLEGQPESFDWPDFDEEELYKVLVAFNHRERRYGRLPGEN